MTIRFESDVVYASNASQELAKLVIQYLELWKQYANGRNDVIVPSEPYDVVFTKLKKEGYVSFKLVYLAKKIIQEPEYHEVDDCYGPDDDQYSEHWGASNKYGSHTETTYHDVIKYVPTEKAYDIPIQTLLSPKVKISEAIIRYVAVEVEKEKEAARLAAIAKLEKEMAAKTAEYQTKLDKLKAITPL